MVVEVVLRRIWPGITERSLRMAKGKVKWFDAKKGFGFITKDDGGDIFVHHTGITGEGFKSLTQGQEVEFEVTEGDRGPKATNVRGVENKP
jgi:CspA family cold shock protein